MQFRDYLEFDGWNIEDNPVLMAHKITAYDGFVVHQRVEEGPGSYDEIQYHVKVSVPSVQGIECFQLREAPIGRRFDNRLIEILLDVAVNLTKDAANIVRDMYRRMSVA